MSMKNSNETIGNRTRHLPACSAVPQPTVPPDGSVVSIYSGTNHLYFINVCNNINAVFDVIPYYLLLLSFVFVVLYLSYIPVLSL
jgi:hypothetical protein